MGTWCVPSRGLLTISTQGLCPSTRPSVGVTILQGEEGGLPGHCWSSNTDCGAEAWPLPHSANVPPTPAFLCWVPAGHLCAR